jgi:predicted dehydrogenase
LLYHPAIERAKALLEAGALGEVLYLYAQRVNLGIVRSTENAWWSLAAHDIAVAIHLFGATPVAVSATGATYLQRDRGVEDIAFAALRFTDGRMAHLHVSWLDPHKRRALTVVGTRKMLTFDDTLPDEKLKIYDKGAVPRPGHATYAEGVAVRSGEVVSPVLPNVEPLLAECAHFLSCVDSGARPRSDGAQGLAVVRALEAGERSMREGGAPIAIASAP